MGAAVAPSRTPVTLGQAHVARLRDVALDDAAIVDVIHGAAFISWANRLMLSLGEPVERGDERLRAVLRRRWKAGSVPGQTEVNNISFNPD
jgi:hypothetical protein